MTADRRAAIVNPVRAYRTEVRFRHAAQQLADAAPDEPPRITFRHPVWRDALRRMAGHR